MSLTSFLSFNPKKYLIFDFDETIAKLVIDWENMLAGMYADLAKVDLELMASYTPRSMSFSFWNKLIEERGASIKELIESHFIKAESVGLSNVIPNPPLIDFIKSHPSEYVYYIWSNNQRKTIATILHKEGLSRNFKAIISANDTLLYKPDTTGIEKIISGDKKDWLMIGDSENDKLAAKALGIDFFLVDFFK